ncbi:MAG TPA: hypothetical protein VNW25_01795 [Candidatus Sulfotelmatobacter sp.]|nr:hypothetical protein [Candidatus Sulfotelmatobacter sp.]
MFRNKLTTRRVRFVGTISLLVEGFAAIAASGYAAHPAPLPRSERTIATCAAKPSNPDPSATLRWSAQAAVFVN